MEEFTIFTESNEDMGLLFDGYKGIGEQVKSFLGIIEGKISELLKDPQHASADLREEITKFKAAVDKKPTPKPINISKVGATKTAVKNYRSDMEKVLDRYAKARDKMSFGGNLMRSIIMKPKVYSKEIDSESYANNNRNIRNIERALDWVEKVLIDLFNLIDQDLNILTLVGKVYGKRKIYEHTEIFQSGDFDAYKGYANLEDYDDDLLNTSICTPQRRSDIFTEDRYFKVLKSDLDDDYVPRGHKSLSDFTKTHITKEHTKIFKDQGKLIKWMRDQDPKYGDDCWIWIDDEGDYVGAITYDQDYDKDHHKWISGIDVAYKYAGYGIGKQLLEEAIKDGANALDVQKDNEIAIRMYKKRGFRISEESQEKVDSGKSVTYQMFLDEDANHINNDPPAGRASMKACYIDPYTNETHLYPSGYSRPLTYDLLPDHLKDDEVHSWRAKYGIELIHKEPSIEELERIWNNWQLMSDVMKDISDKKSLELFNQSNRDHYKELITGEEYTEASDDPPPNMPEEGSNENGKGEKQPEGDREISQTSDVPTEDAEVHDEPQEPEADQPKEEVKESMPKKTDQVESSKNGVRRKKLYVAFIEWAKEYNSKNTFGSIFDKDIFHNVYPFVPEEMRYFYRLANPILCVLSGDLTFFQVSELKKLNAENKEMDKLLIFAATPNDLRVFNKEDKRTYLATEADGKIMLGESIGDTFDLYIQKMIKKGDILNGPLDSESK